jgi:hypothetical protein
MAFCKPIEKKKGGEKGTKLLLSITVGTAH